MRKQDCKEKGVNSQLIFEKTQTTVEQIVINAFMTKIAYYYENMQDLIGLCNEYF